MAGESIGTETEHNSLYQSAQLIMALALSHDPRIEEVVQQEKPGPVFKIGILSKFLEKWGGVLNGIKIIDIGCGYLPIFARASRGLGAEVYTADIIPASQFQNFQPSGYNDKRDERELADHELANKFHIQIDLDDKDALQKILDTTGGEFDFATEAHSSSGATHGHMKGIDIDIVNPWKNYNFKPSEDFYNALLKKGGIFFAINRGKIGSGPLYVDEDGTEIEGNLGLDIKI